MFPCSVALEHPLSMTGYVIGEPLEDLLVDISEPLLEDPEIYPIASSSKTVLVPPSPLRPSLRLSRSSSISFEPSALKIKGAGSPSSLGVPSFASRSSSSLLSNGSSLSQTSITTNESGDESDDEDSDVDDGSEISSSISNMIPNSRGAHFHAHPKQFVILPPPSSSVHRVISVHLTGNKVREVKSRKPFGVNSSALSFDDLTLSAKGKDHVVLVRRTSKNAKVSVTIHRRGSLLSVCQLLNSTF